MSNKTSLRNFQSHIEKIRHREITRQRDQAAAAERAKEKEVKKSAGRTPVNEPTIPGKVEGTDTQIKDPAELSDVEEQIQVRHASSITKLKASWTVCTS